jgi:regulator of cell morphogenesis and NO signaling
MTAYNETTLATLVAQRPSRARVLEDLGLDYCCGGDRTLAKACAEMHLDVADLCQRLEASDGMPAAADDLDLRVIPLSQLIEHIIDVHHQYVRQELPRLDALLRRVILAHAAKHPELRYVHTIFLGLREELSEHMRKEEQVLFPWIEMLEDPLRSDLPGMSVANPIHRMEHEHRDAAQALQRMRELTGGYQPPADACASYRALLSGLLDFERDLHRHVHKENNILFPRAAALESQAMSVACR